MNLASLLLLLFTFHVAVHAATGSGADFINPCNVLGEGSDNNPSYCNAFDTDENMQNPVFECCVICANDCGDFKLPAALRGSVTLLPNRIQIDHDGKNSALYPMDSSKANEIEFTIDKISAECFDNGIFKLVLAYANSQPDSSSDSCNLCKTTIDIKASDSPIAVSIGAKDGAKHQVSVKGQGTTFPACTVDLQKWPNADHEHFLGEHFYLPFRILSTDRSNCKVTLTFAGSYRLLFSQETDGQHNNLGITTKTAKTAETTASTSVLTSQATTTVTTSPSTTTTPTTVTTTTAIPSTTASTSTPTTSTGAHRETDKTSLSQHSSTSPSTFKTPKEVFEAKFYKCCKDKKLDESGVKDCRSDSIDPTLTQVLASFKNAINRAEIFDCLNSGRDNRECCEAKNVGEGTTTIRAKKNCSDYCTNELGSDDHFWDTDCWSKSVRRDRLFECYIEGALADDRYLLQLDALKAKFSRCCMGKKLENCVPGCNFDGMRSSFFEKLNSENRNKTEGKIDFCTWHIDEIFGCLNSNRDNSKCCQAKNVGTEKSTFDKFTFGLFNNPTECSDFCIARTGAYDIEDLELCWNDDEKKGRIRRRKYYECFIEGSEA